MSAADTPTEAEYGYDAAEMMLRTGRREEASSLLWEVIRKHPRHADAWALRGLIEDQAGRPQNAMLHHAMALQAAPNRHDLWCNRGIAAMSARMYREAEESFVRSLSIHDTFEGHYNYANLLCASMRVDEAVEQFKLALKLNNGNDQINANLGVAMIAQGKWLEGFNAYRHRFNAPGFPPRPRFDYPQWRGEPLAGKTIMLYAEQGFGDEIMSLRFGHSIKTRGARVILAVRPPMFRLARSVHGGFLWGADDIILMYDPPPVEPDYMCAMLDVSAFVDITPQTVPCRGHYLAAENRGFRLAMPAGLNVGICWASGKRDLQPHVAETAKQKSISFQSLASILHRPGVNLFSLQQIHNEDLAAFNVRDPMGGVTDFSDTAFIVEHLDLVVTVDTSIAHLAGALGKPVWNLVRFDALWPWGQETSTTCWYDSMTLYRQSKPFDWADPLKRVADDFAVLLTERSRGDKPLAVA